MKFEMKYKSASMADTVRKKATEHHGDIFQVKK